jgi:hypothetical protein
VKGREPAPTDIERAKHVLFILYVLNGGKEEDEAEAEFHEESDEAEAATEEEFNKSTFQGTRCKATSSLLSRVLAARLPQVYFPEYSLQGYLKSTFEGTRCKATSSLLSRVLAARLPEL